MDVRLDELPELAVCHTEDHFLIQRVECNNVRSTPIMKSSSVPAVLVSVSLCPVSPSSYRLWIDGKLVPARETPPYRVNVIDFEAQPTILSTGPYRYVHFNVRRSRLDDIATELGRGRASDVRTTTLEADIVLAQLARSALGILERTGDASPIILDELENVIAAHVLQRYCGVTPKNTTETTGLAARKRRRATELLRAHLDGSVRLADLARECELSVSHFARAFKASFGMSPHRWLVQRRIERAQQLIAETDLPLAEVAVQSGFKDQAAFTRTFRRIVGMPPGSWRREHATR